MRPIGFILRTNSPILLAREVIWRTQKLWRRKRFLSTVHGSRGHLRLRWPAYYRPEVSLCSAPASAVIVSVADKVCSGHFSLLGYEFSNIGFPPRWNVDFVSGKDWPLVHTESISTVRHDGSDVKVPWELSRLQYLPVLGKAYRLTGREQYRSAAIKLVSDWIEQNPVGMGVNWTVPMEVALRAMSICFLVDLLAPARPDESEWFGAVERVLREHFLFIESHIEFSHLYRGNHYLSNIVGLLCLSIFMEGPGMQARRKYYASKVEREIFHQVYEDGGDYEASTGYHVFVTQLFTSAFLLMRCEGISPDPRFRDRLRAMYRWMGTLADSHGSLPQMGDCDDGRVEVLFDDLKQMECLPVEARSSLKVSSLLGLGKAIFESTPSASCQDSLWYGVGGNQSRIDNSEWARPSSTSVFVQSGIAVQRKGTAEVLFFAVPNGIGGKGSHTHNDKLSIVLRIGDEELLCESGTYFYTREAEARNRFRGTAAHNTLMVDGQEQNSLPTQPNALFCLGNEAAVSPIESQEKDGGVAFKASHFGYRNLGVSHSRSLKLEEDSLLIEDCLEGAGKHQFQHNLHLPPAWKVQLLRGSGKEVSFQISGPRSISIMMRAPVEMHASRQEVSLSRSYGATYPGTRISATGDGVLPLSIQTHIAWEV